MTTVGQKEVGYFQHQVRCYWKWLLEKLKSVDLQREKNHRIQVSLVRTKSAMSAHQGGLRWTKQKGLCSGLSRKLAIKHWVFRRVSTDGIANIYYILTKVMFEGVLNLEKQEQTLKVNELDQHLSFLENKHNCLCLGETERNKKRILEKYNIFPLKFSGK